MLIASAFGCTVRRLTADEFADDRVLSEPVLVAAASAPPPLEALDALTVRVVSASSADSMLYSQFGRGAAPAEPQRFAAFAANASGMVFSFGDEAETSPVEAVMPSGLAAQAARVLERASLAAGDECAQSQPWHTPLVSAGGRRTGLRLHQHGAAWLYLLSGAKRWWLAHPESDLFDEPSRAEAVALASVSDEAEWPPPGAAPLCSVEQRPGELLFVPAMWFHATRNTGGGLTLGVGAQTVLSSLPREAALAEVSALHRAFPRCARLEAYLLEGEERPTRASAARLAALVRRDPWHLPARLTLLRHSLAAGGGAGSGAALEVAADLEAHVRRLVEQHAALTPLDARFVLGAAAEQLHEAARARLAPRARNALSESAKALFLGSARLQDTARSLLVGAGERGADGAALPTQHRAAWLEAVTRMASSSYAGGAQQAVRECVRALRAMPPHEGDDAASEARAVAEKLARALGSRERR